MKLYLDNCCFNRPYDEQSHIMVQLETTAKLYVQACIAQGKLALHWSYILDYENDKNPFVVRKQEIQRWRDLAASFSEPADSILAKSILFQNAGLKAFDALHVACAVDAGCDYFLTVDHGVLKKRNAVKGLFIVTPIEFIDIWEEKK